METLDDFGVPPIGNDKLPPLEEMFERCDPYEYGDTKLMCIGKSKRLAVPVIRKSGIDNYPKCACILIEVHASVDTDVFLAQHATLQCACSTGISASLLAMCDGKMIRSERIQANQYAHDRKDSSKETEDRALRHFLAMFEKALDQGYKPVHSEKEPSPVNEVQFRFCPCWAALLDSPTPSAEPISVTKEEARGQKRPASPSIEDNEEPCAKRARAAPSDVEDAENTQIEE